MAVAVAEAAGAAQDPRGPEYAPGRVLVRLRQTQASGPGNIQGSTTAASAAAAEGDASLPPGLQLERLVGRHHTVRVPPPPAAKRVGGATAVATDGSAGGTSSELLQDAVCLLRITDGSSVAVKLAELRAHPGAGCFSSHAAAAVALCRRLLHVHITPLSGWRGWDIPMSIRVRLRCLPTCLQLLLQVWRWQNQTTFTTPPLGHSRQEQRQARQERQSQVAAAAPSPSPSPRRWAWLAQLPQQTQRPCRMTPNTQVCGTCQRFRHPRPGTPQPAPARCAGASDSGTGALMACPWLQAVLAMCSTSGAAQPNLFHVAVLDCRSACA